ncbi:MAG: hypothetical protein H7Y60_11735 [Rhodospirillaceae bacterium]|nr:hypothetical protein [Rhodospirillales bacterium]
MITVDLMSDGHYPPLDSRSPQELFELAVRIAQSLDNVCVRVPVSDQMHETVILSSKLMRKRGAMMF